MMTRTVALRYAKGLFDLDVAKNNLEKRLSDFESMQALLISSPKLVRFLEAPQIELEEKKRVLQSCLTDKVDPTFLHFLFYLIDKRRFSDFTQIASEYQWMRDNYLRVWNAQMLTATPVDRQMEEKLKEKLENFYQKKINIQKEINPKMIGGAILIIANKMIDWSVRSRLKRMKEYLLATNH